MHSVQVTPSSFSTLDTGKYQRRSLRKLVILIATLATVGGFARLFPDRGHLYAAATASNEPLAELVARVEKNTRSLQDITMSIEIEQYHPQTKEKAVITGKVQMKLPDILRLNYLSPDFVAGQVMVINRAAGELRVYLPVTHEIVVQDLKTLMSKQGLDVALGLDSLVGLPPTSLFHLTYLGEEIRDGKKYHVVKAVPRTAEGTLGWEKIWLSAQELIAHRLEVYNQEGQLSYVLTVKETKINSGLQPSTLLSLPRDAKVVTAGSGS
ncbi:MAG: outer membrane lipoprotein carrier protein LolA [Limnochordales bacterium]|nr:outer membrane lipoprotein carrier protein LolA [Limnochordales bacterium]